MSSGFVELANLVNPISLQYFNTSLFTTRRYLTMSDPLLYIVGEDFYDRISWKFKYNSDISKPLKIQLPVIFKYFLQISEENVKKSDSTEVNLYLSKLNEYPQNSINSHFKFIKQYSVAVYSAYSVILLIIKHICNFEEINISIIEIFITINALWIFSKKICVHILNAISIRSVDEMSKELNIASAIADDLSLIAIPCLSYIYNTID